MLDCDASHWLKWFSHIIYGKVCEYELMRIGGIQSTILNLANKQKCNKKNILTNK